MLFTKKFISIIAVLVLAVPVFADVTVLCLDTSGSMKTHGFEEAKAAILRTLNEIDGSVMIIGFDVNDYEIWKGEVTGQNRQGVIKAVRQRLTMTQPTGGFTHIEEALDCGKLFLLSEKATGIKKLIVFSDGINLPDRDVDRYHRTVDLKQIAETIIPQNLGFSVYFIGLVDDLEGFFQANADSTGFVGNVQYPHVKGIPVHDYDPSSVEQAFTKAIDDDPATSQPERKLQKTAGKLGKILEKYWYVLLAIIAAGVAVVFVVSMLKKRNTIQDEEMPAAQPESAAVAEPLFENALQIKVQCGDLPAVHYPLTDGTSYTLGVDIPLPSVTEGFAVIRMDKGRITIEPFTQGIRKEDAEINGITELQNGDVILYKDITIQITSEQFDEDMILTSVSVDASSENGSELNREDLDLL